MVALEALWRREQFRREFVLLGCPRLHHRAANQGKRFRELPFVPTTDLFVLLTFGAAVVIVGVFAVYTKLYPQANRFTRAERQF
jgi:hypothetical protein